MASDSDFGLSETTSSIGGFFGDVLEGLKPATVDALGYKLRAGSGLYDGLQQPTQADRIAAYRLANPPGVFQPGNNLLLYVGIGLASLAGLALVVKG